MESGQSPLSHRPFRIRGGQSTLCHSERCEELNPVYPVHPCWRWDTSKMRSDFFDSPDISGQFRTFRPVGPVGGRVGSGRIRHGFRASDAVFPRSQAGFDMSAAGTPESDGYYGRRVYPGLARGGCLDRVFRTNRWTGFPAQAKWASPHHSPLPQRRGDFTENRKTLLRLQGLIDRL